MIDLGAKLVHRICDGRNPEGVSEQAEPVGVFDLGLAGGAKSSAHERNLGTQRG